MGLFSRKKSGKKGFVIPDIPFDPATQKAVVKCSICTGEQVAGFKDRKSGRIMEVTLIRDEEELKMFMEHYGISEIEKVY